MSDEFFTLGAKTFRRNLPLEVKPNANGWYRGWVKPDWLSAAWGFKVRDVAPAPAVNRIGIKSNTNSHNKIGLTLEYQTFWADLIALHLYALRYDELWNVQKSYVAGRVNALMGPELAFTNRSVSDLVAYYLTGENLDQAAPRYAPLICAGNTVWCVPDGEVGKIASFLTGMPLPPATKELLLDPRVLWATVIRPGSNQIPPSVGPFPQLEGASVPYPLITDQPYYFPLQGLELYSHDEPIRSQYIPPREYYP